MQPPGDTGEHRVYEEMAVEHVLGGLQPERGRLFRAHLLDCSDCRARVGELRAIASDLAGVERDERRVIGAHQVETKRRRADHDQADEVVPQARPALAPRLVGLFVMVVVIGLGGYVFVLRAQLGNLQGEFDDRLDAMAALEHGAELPPSLRAPGVEVTVKRHEDNVVLLAEGLDDERSYGLYMVEESGAESRTVFRRPVAAVEGRLLVLLPLPESGDQLIVTERAEGFSPEPDGVTLLQVAVR